MDYSRTTACKSSKACSSKSTAVLIAKAMTLRPIASDVAKGWGSTTSLEVRSNHTTGVDAHDEPRFGTMSAVLLLAMWKI